MTIPEMLAGHAAEYHAKATDARKAAEDAKPTVEHAAATMTSTRKTMEALETQLADLQQLLADARAGHEQAVTQHADALAAYAEHRAVEQDAVRIAEGIEQLAEKHRAAQAPAAPGEALVSTGLPVHPRAAAPAPAEPDEDLPFNVVQAPDEVVAALTGGTQMIHDPDALASKTPLTTLTDPPKADGGEPRHARPKKSIDFSGAFKTITGRLGADQPNGDDQP